MSVPANVRLKQVYKGVNIYHDVDDTGMLTVVYKKHHEYIETCNPKSLKGAKAWITRNKTFKTYTGYPPQKVTINNTTFY